MHPDDILGELQASATHATFEVDRELYSASAKEIVRLRELFTQTENELKAIRNFVCEQINHQIECVELNRPSETFDAALLAHLSEERLRTYRRVDRKLLSMQQKLIASQTNNYPTSQKTENE